MQREGRRRGRLLWKAVGLKIMRRDRDFDDNFADEKGIFCFLLQLQN